METERRRKAAEFIIQYRIVILLAMLVLAGWSAAMISRTHINFDLNRYLADDTMTKRAMKVMEEEFGAAEQLRLMFSGLQETAAPALPVPESTSSFSPEPGTQKDPASGLTLQQILDALNAREEVRLAVHDPVTGTAQAFGKTWTLITLTLNSCDEAAFVTELREMFPAAGTYYVGGSAAVQLDVQKSVVVEIPEVMVIAIAIVLLVLLLTSHAWLEPAAILFVLAISIVINMGTNFIFPDVSFITFSVCAILQLALSIDYAIMLLHTYNGCRGEGLSAREAMAEALAQCFMRIASSAMTTIAGLLSLLFMSFTIGFDIGVVLSKGIVISMLCVFLLMPSVVLLMEKPLSATRHRPLKLGGEHLAAGILRFRLPLAIILVLSVIAGAWLNSRNTYTFTDPGTADNSDTARINEVFGTSSPLVLLVPGGDSDADYDRQRNLAGRLRSLRLADGQPSIREITAMVTTGAAALEYYTAQEAADLTGQPLFMVSLFFVSEGFESPVRADRLLDAAGASFAEGNETLAGLQEALASAREAFLGPHYARMLLDISFQSSDPDFNDNMDAILSAVREEYGEDFYITGIPMSSYDIGNAFRGDLLRVNLITFLAILLIVMISFRAFRLPLLLVFVIEGAIWITMGFSCLIGQPIFFISYLICLAIQMGATIDYGILFCDQYRNQRRLGLDAQPALAEAMKRALPTVLTSGIILVTAGYIIGKRCSVYYISSIGLLVSRGAFVSALLVLTLLPALLLLFDHFIIRGSGF